MKNYQFYIELGQILCALESIGIISKPKHTRIDNSKNLYLQFELQIIAEPYTKAVRELDKVLDEFCEKEGADYVTKPFDRSHLTITMLK